MKNIAAKDGCPFSSYTGYSQNNTKKLQNNVTISNVPYIN